MSISHPVGATVRRLRTGLGINQGELAGRIGLATGVMSMIENDRVSASTEIIEALASVLDCEPGYLLSSASDLEISRPWLRAYADAPSRVVEQTIADSATAIEASIRLGLQFVADQVPAFDGDLNDDEQIEEAASETRAHAGLGEGEVVRNMMRSAERLGCVVLPMDSELGRHLGISTRIEGIPTIRVSRPSSAPGHHVPGDRQRFTVAHELGHLVLHHERRPPGSASEAARIEKQAHRFAAAYIAPADALMSDLERLGGRVTLNTLASLKEIWGIAIKALVLRFQHLTVIDEDHARSLYKQISSRRWNKSEPVSVENETSVWLAKAISKRFGTTTDPVEAAASLVGLNRTYFYRWTDWEGIEGVPGTASISQLVPSQLKGASNNPDPKTGLVTRLPIR